MELRLSFQHIILLRHNYIIICNWFETAANYVRWQIISCKAGQTRSRRASFPLSTESIYCWKIVSICQHYVYNLFKLPALLVQLIQLVHFMYNLSALLVHCLYRRHSRAKPSCHTAYTAWELYHFFDAVNPRNMWLVPSGYFGQFWYIMIMYWLTRGKRSLKFEFPLEDIYEVTYLIL